jgi:D-serine deaminase-like pyridoxal phosphate-dependent protein
VIESRFDLPTPALLVDEEVLLANLRDMAAVAESTGVVLRPHWKTHKCVEVARLQRELGAVGGTVAKAGEAEVFLAAGFRDVLVATPVVEPGKIRRLLEVRGEARLSVLIESEEGVARWSAAAAESGGRPVPVMLEIDPGMGRTGVRPGAGALPLAGRIHGAAGLELAGVMAHAGQAYVAASPEEVARIGAEEGRYLVETRNALDAAGLPCPVVSAGSTPTARHVAKVEGVTEIRPGNYPFHDGIQVALGVCPPERCALTVLATVTARPAADRVVLDCGAKTLTADDGKGLMAGFGAVVGRPDLRLAKLSEEHGILPVPADTELSVGDRVRVLPNHACVTVNLHDELVVVRGDAVVDRWRIAARGRVA